MRILVHEFVTGGGLAGRPVSRALAREGSSMLAALVEDLAAIRGHQIVATADPRFPLEAPPGVEIVTLASPRSHLLDVLIRSADAVWPLAPETDGCLERLVRKVERSGKRLLGPGSAAVRACDKASLARRLRRYGVPHPATCVITSRASHPRADWQAAARVLRFPVVVKPARGAGCGHVCLARDPCELDRAASLVRAADRAGSLLLQQYVPGVAASVSLLTNGRRAVPLAVNAQHLRLSTLSVGGRDAAALRSFTYCGGRTPLDHPVAGRAVETALATCRVLPGLRGWIGVDLVLTGSEAVVIEVNPRLTTAYLGVRAALDRDGRGHRNIAAMALAACNGMLPAARPLWRAVRFNAAGGILSARLLSSTDIARASCPQRAPRASARSMTVRRTSNEEES
jgi:predicted ATP-grasp superfamily ATP-dependent carboligase